MLCRCPPPRHITVTLLYSCAFLLLGLNIAAVGPLLEDLTAQVGVELASGGALFSSRASGYFLGSLATSAIDRWPRQGNRVISVGLFVAGVMTALVPLMPSLGAAGVCFFFVGVSMGTLDCGANVMLMNEFAARNLRVDSAMQTLHAAFAVGAFVSPIWMHFVKVEAGHAVALWSMAALFPLVAVVLLLVLGTPTVRPKAEPAAAADDDGVLEAVSVAAPSRRLKVLELAVTFVTAVFLGLYVGCEVGAGGFIDVYASRFVGLSADESAVLNSALWGSFALARIAAIFVASKLSPFSIMVGSLLLGVTALLLPIVVGVSRGTVWVAFMAFGVAMAPCFPTAFTYCDRVMRGGLSATRAALLATGAAFGEFAIPWAIGEIMAATTLGSFTWSLEVGMCGAALAFVIVVLLARALHPGSRSGLPPAVQPSTHVDADADQEDGVALIESER